MANQRISEKKKIRRVKPCGNVNELFLAWLNPRGGIESYLFEADYGITRNTSNPYMINQYVEEIENGEGFISMVKKSSFKELGLVAPMVDKQTRVGLETLLESPKVKLLLNGLNKAWDVDPVITDKWQEVISVDGRFDQGDSDEDVYDFNLSIQLQPRKTLMG